MGNDVMFNSISIQICSLVYVVMLIVVYLYKRKYNSLENGIYKVMLINTLFILILDLMSIFTIRYYVNFSFINGVFSKGFLVLVGFWFGLFLLYTMVCEYKDNFKCFSEAFKKSRGVKVWLGMMVLMFIGIVYFPVEYSVDDIYMYGKSFDFTYYICVFMSTISLVILAINRKRISGNRWIPMMLFLFSLLIVFSVQFLCHNLLIISSGIAIVTVFMYFILVNPDIRYIDELNALREEAENANRAKTDFLASMSHEIRTPMNAIIGLTDSALSNELSDSVREDIKNINNAGQILLEIINNILDISKIEEGKMELSCSSYSISNIVLELSNIVMVRIGDKPIKFNMSIDPNIPRKLYGDETKIFQICLNILNNAAKYTDKGEIDFSVSSRVSGDDCMLTFRVSDTGKGIKKEDYDKLFVKFERLDKEVNQTIEGTGLGLVITKEMVELMGGKLGFSSEYGKGSVFTVSIPQRVMDHAIVGVINSLDLKEKEVEYFNGARFKILIVDDNKLNLKVAEKLMRPYNFQITTVTSGLACLNYTKKNKYDLIFLDHMMPEMDGIQTMRYLKQRVDFVNTPIVALTANAISGMKEMYLREGFDDYLSKPIDQVKLNEILRKYLLKDGGNDNDKGTGI